MANLSTKVAPSGVLTPTGDGSRLTGVSLVPTGAVFNFVGVTPPAGYLKANGAGVSRTTYADLFAIIGTLFGNGDGSTTFTLPDLRGEFVRGLDDGRNVDTGRFLGTSQGDAIRNITGTFQVTDDDSNNYRARVRNASGVFSANEVTGFPFSSGGSPSATFDGELNFDASDQVPTADENRPRNVALMYCIKT